MKKKLRYKFKGDKKVTKTIKKKIVDFEKLEKLMNDEKNVLVTVCEISPIAEKIMKETTNYHDIVEKYLKNYKNERKIVIL